MHQDHIKPQAPAGISNLKMGRKTVAISDGLTRFYTGIKRCLQRNTLTFRKVNIGYPMFTLSFGTR